MRVLKEFDPWKNPLCTCPPKYSLNPYTGCAHHCIYCYASSYIPRMHECRPKRNFIQDLKKDVRKARRDMYVSMSNSSDPYPPMERHLNLTRKTLAVLKAHNIRVLVLTKSDIVARDVDLLSRMVCAVSITVTTLRDNVKLIEPGAPAPASRLKAMSILSKSGIPVVLRLDPIIPGINDDERSVLEVVRLAKEAGARHVVSSTLKLRPNIIRRMRRVLGDSFREVERLYREEGERVGGNLYLPRKMRYDLLKMVKTICEEHSLTFAVCREGFTDLFTAPSCDGSHLFALKSTGGGSG